ncbi:MAG: FHA domain-containing protein [Rhodothermales bacterium]
MIARLFSKTGALAGTDHLIEREAVIGRDAKCDLVLFPHTISGRHARIYFSEEKQAYYIEDLGSSNGTQVDRVPLSGPARLDDLNVITFASDIFFVFQVMASAPAHAPSARSRPTGAHTSLGEAFVPPPDLGSPPPADDPGMRTSFGQSFDALPDLAQPDLGSMGKDAPPPAPPAPPPPVVRTFEVKLADGGAASTTLKSGIYLIGRLPSSDIVVADSFVSSRHAELRVDGAVVTITDLNSSNHTYVNDVQISEATRLEPGDTVRFGPKTTATLR